MKKLAFLFIILSTPAFAQGFSPQWLDCATDSDCLPIQGSCTGLAVNKAFEKEVTQWVQDLDKRTDCPIPNPRVTITRCENKQCVLQKSESK